MDVPRLPTDNLYKFLALAGLVTALFALGLEEIQLDHVTDRYAQAGSLGDSVTEYLKIFEDTARSIDERNSALAAARRIAPTMNVATSRAEFADRMASYSRPALIFTMIFGAVVSWAGFGLWYSRYQRFEDMRVKAEAEAAVARTKPPGARFE